MKKLFPLLLLLSICSISFTSTVIKKSVSTETYEITVQANPAIGGSVTGGGMYEEEEDVTVTATPNPNYNFISWTEDGLEVSSNASYQFIAESDRTLVANFELKKYNISVSANPTEFGNVTITSDDIEEPTVRTIIGWDFADGNVIADFGIPENIKRTISNVNAGTISFLRFPNHPRTPYIQSDNWRFYTVGRYWLIDFTTIGFNAVTVSSRQNSTSGGPRDFIIEYSLNGTTWDSVPGSTITISAPPSTSINNTTGVVSDLPLPEECYNKEKVWLRWRSTSNYATNGNAQTGVSPVSGLSPRNQLTNVYVKGYFAQGAYTHGEEVTVTAIPKTGYHLVNWTDDGNIVSTDASYKFTATEDLNLVANFAINTYNITVGANPVAGGIVTGDGTYTHGDPVTITATTNHGYEFMNWIDMGANIVSTETSYTFIAENNRNLIANFNELGKYFLNLEVFPASAGEATGGGSFYADDVITISATSYENYEFVAWRDGATQLTTDSTYDYIMPAEHKTLRAMFQGVEKFINATASPIGGGTVSGNGTYKYGETATLIATANTSENYYFVNWTEGGSVVSSIETYTFTVTNNRNLVANFEVETYLIAVSAYPLAGGIVSGNGLYAHGETVTVTAIPNSNYNFVRWAEGSTTVNTNASYTFTANGDRDLVAFFELKKYAVTLTANPEEGGIVTGDGAYAHGDPVTVTATANTGYDFIDWTEDGIEISDEAEYTFIAENDINLVANFQIKTYTVTLSAAPEEGGSVYGDGTFNYGETITIIAEPNENYNFIGWHNGEGIISDALEYELTVYGNYTFKAMFDYIEVQYHTITASVSGGNGTIAPSGAISVAQGANKTFDITPDTGYKIASVLVDDIETPEAVASGSYTFVNVTDDHTIVASFAIKTYTVTVAANPEEGGEVTGEGEYEHGELVTVTAIPDDDENYEFLYWTFLDGQSTENPYTFTATADITLTANFIQEGKFLVTVTVMPEEAGTITGDGMYSASEEVILEAIPAEAYNFVNWTKEGVEVETETTYTFTIEENVVLNANFELKTYTVSVFADPEEGGSVTGDGTYNHGASVTVTATPNAGYSFVKWTEGGVEVSTSASYNFTASANATLTANFEYTATTTYTITASVSGDNGTIAPSGEVSVEQGADKTFDITPDTGYKTVSVLVDDTENPEAVASGSYTFVNVTDNHTIVASFAIKTYTVTVAASPEDGGDVIGGGEYEHNETVTVTATEKTGYRFVNWTEEGTQVFDEASYTFTITDNRNLVANFVEEGKVQLTINVNPVGAGTVTGAGQYSVNDDVTVTATPNEGYTFLNWTKDGVIQETSTTYDFIITEDMVLTANFELKTYTVTVLASPEEGGEVTGGGTGISHGTTITATATPKAGYRFVNWTVQGVSVSTDEIYNFEVKETIALIGNFTQLTKYDVTFIVSTSGNPLEGAEVKINQETRITDNEGKAKFTLINDTYNYTVVKQSYDVITGTITINGTDITELVAMELGIFENGKTASFEIYPNPVSNKLTIVRTTAEKSLIEIYNSNGALVQTFEMNTDKYELDVSALSSGFYMIRLVDNNNSSILRFMKE
jgi:hypothetical protein